MYAIRSYYGVERSRLLEENNQLREILARQDAGGELVGESAPMRQLKRTVAAVAQSGYTVLIRGESGTGKELVARLIHRLGSRAAKPFVITSYSIHYTKLYDFCRL